MEIDDMKTTCRRCATGALVLTVLGLILHAAFSAEAAKPPKIVSRPIIYVGVNSARTAWNIHRIDAGGTSDIVIKEGNIGGRPRWSADGLMIGGYHTWLGNDPAIMVMNANGADELVEVSGSEFNLWNLSRPGVRTSSLDVSNSDTAWLGSNAILFAGVVGYDASLFGGDPSQTVYARRLFLVDHTGAITPVTEAATFDGTTFSDSDPHWSAALGAVVFVGTAHLSYDVGAANDLYAIHPDGTGLTQITSMGASVQLRAPVWSPTGNHLAVSVENPGTGSLELWILGVDLTQPNPGMGAGGRVTQAYALKTNASAPGNPIWSAWSPDGGRIVFNRTVANAPRSVSDELVIVDAMSGAETVIRKSNIVEAPDWSIGP
jgi:Tol biopolymer transport system component